MRPADFCRARLAVLEASERRRARRPRDTTPDAIGHALLLDLLRAAVRADPEPSGFEAWCARECERRGRGAGPLRSLGLSLLEEWRWAQADPAFEAWLGRGAPSEDA